VQCFDSTFAEFCPLESSAGSLILIKMGRYLGSSEAVKKTAPIREMIGIGGKGKERLRERIIGDDVVNVEAKISG